MMTMADVDFLGTSPSWVRPSDAIWFGEAEDPESKEMWPAKIFAHAGWIRFVFLVPGGGLRAMPNGRARIRLGSVRPLPDKPLVDRLRQEWDLWGDR